MMEWKNLVSPQRLGRRGKPAIARLVADAGGEFAYKENTGHGSTVIGMETAYRLLREADVWLETGLQYNLLPMKGEEGRNLHTLSVPLKFNLTLLQAGKLDLYVSAGGAAEKCVAGAPDNSFKAEPVRLSAMAGLGVRYKLNDRIALFAEPSVSHSFDTDSPLQTLRTERPTNLNLLCGVRMIY